MCIIVYTQIQLPFGVIMEIKPKLQDNNPKAHQEALNTLNQMNNKLQMLIEINQKLLKINEELLNKFDHDDAGKSMQPDSMAILSLPLTLRKTIMVLYRLEEATADDIAKETHRLRAVESASANELVRMGLIKKRREGRDVHFYIESAEETSD
jgi:DNA-binding MarR family transcriptional regulator